MKIAIVRLSALGDIVFSMTVLQFIKNAHPICTIDWYCDSAFVPLLEGNPHINSIIGLDIKSLKNSFSLALFLQNLQKLRGRDYDLVLDLQGLLKSAIVARMLGKNCVGFDKHSTREGAASAFYSAKVSSAYEKNVVLRYMDMIKVALDIEVWPSALQELEKFIFCDKKSDEQAKTQKIVLIAPGASRAYKKYPKEKYAQIANALEAQVLVCHNSDEELADAHYICQHSGATLLPKSTIDELKCIIDSCDLVIGADSGVTHIAFGMKRPSIALFGATPAYRNAYETAINKTISSGAIVNPKKLDKNDFSVADIDAREIANLARTLLER